MKKIIIICIQIIFLCIGANAQIDIVEDDKKLNIFIGYDLGEMAFNKFQNFAGEAGLKLNNDHMIRFVYINIKLTEWHLSSGFAGAVDGDNVKGQWNGYEFLYDIPIIRFKNRDMLVYGGPSIGYHKNSYKHTMLNETVEHETATVGFDLGFRESNLLNINGLYMYFQIPVRYNIKKLDEAKLGDAIVNESVISQTVSFYIGYEF